jgi:acetate kinase
MNVLVLNCGSASIKFQLIATDLENISRSADERLARGTIQRVGGREGAITREGSRLAAYVIPTDEELLTARDTVRCVEGVPPGQ